MLRDCYNQISTQSSPQVLVLRRRLSDWLSESSQKGSSQYQLCEPYFAGFPTHKERTPYFPLIISRPGGLSIGIGEREVGLRVTRDNLRRLEADSFYCSP